MIGKSWLLAAMMTATAFAGTFGTVVSIGGEASDVALDEPRGVLYIANFTANRIDVMSLATNTIRTSINVSAQPSSLALSPDGHWLLVAHYGNNTAPSSPTNGLTLIDLTAGNARQVFALGDAPLGVAFGIDNKALVVTTSAFILFDPAVGTTTTLQSIQATAGMAIPVPLATFPPTVTGAAVASSADFTYIYGLADNLLFSYDVAHHALGGGNYTSSPAQGPRTVSVAADGSYAAMGWIITTPSFFDLAEFHSPAGILNIGSHTVDSVRNVIYSQVSHSSSDAPVLQVLDADNLTLRETLQLPENTTGKTALSHDGSTIYAVSSSGVLVLPVGSLNKAPRVAASAEDLVFRGNFCDRNMLSQTITISDPGGNHTPFAISTSTAGITLSPSSGVTPANVTVTVDPNAFAGAKGTTVAALAIGSSAAVNVPRPVRVLINAHEPDQRGTFIDIPGTVVDLLADSQRNQYYVLRQDKNQVLVFNSTNNTQIATLRTCPWPMSMAETLDGAELLVGCDSAHVINVFDLASLNQLPSINTYSGYAQSIAVSSKAILAVMRDGSGGSPYIASVDLVTRVASKLRTLGIFNNSVALNTVLTASPNGSHILAASSDGTTLLYDANVDTFTASRKDFNSLSGAYAASAYDRYLVGSTLLDASLVPTMSLETSTGNPSGFVFVDAGAIRTTAPDVTSAGVIQHVDIKSGAGIRPTRMVEAPILGVPPPSSPNGSTCTTVTNGGQTTQTCVTTQGTVQTTTVQVCTNSGSTGNSTQTCTTTSSTANLTVTPTQSFTRSLALVQDRSELISLSTSGITILPYTYDAAVTSPQINAVVSAADSKSPAAPGGLISVYGTSLSPTNQASSQIPVPTALAESCLTVNGQPMPLIFVSPQQINAQMPFQAFGNVTMVVHTPGGVSDNFYLTVQPNAPAVFLSGTAGPQTNLPTVVRQENNLLVTDSDPIHRGDHLVIYLTGMGAVSPVVPNGMPAPTNPLALTLTQPQVRLGNVDLFVDYAGLAPGEVGVYQLNVTVPASAPQGLSVPLSITQGSSTQTVNVRVVQ